MTDNIPANETAMLHEFITTFEAKPDWVALVEEESKEVVQALENLLKEVVDLCYVFTGLELSGQKPPEGYQSPQELKTAAKWLGMLGMVFDDDMLREAFTRVHQSNMSKVGDDGKPIRREDGKILKGPNYKPAVLTDLIHNA